jgi:hypothetical protein
MSSLKSRFKVRCLHRKGHLDLHPQGTLPYLKQYLVSVGRGGRGLQAQYLQDLLLLVCLHGWVPMLCIPDASCMLLT